MLITAEDMERVLHRRETVDGDKRPMTAVGRANAIKHLLRLRNRCPENKFLVSIEHTIATLNGAPVTRLKDLYKIIALVDSLTSDECKDIFQCEGARNQALEACRAHAQSLLNQCQRPALPISTSWEQIQGAVAQKKDEMISLAVRLEDKLSRNVHVPKGWSVVLQNWLLAAFYVYHPPRRNEYQCLLVRGFDRAADNYVLDGWVVLNQYSTSYYRGVYTFPVPDAISVTLNALTALRVHGGVGSSEKVHLFTKANGHPLLADAYTDAVRNAFRSIVGAGFTSQCLGQLFVNHHSAAGTLPGNIEQAMGRSVTPVCPPEPSVHKQGIDNRVL